MNTFSLQKLQQEQEKSASKCKDKIAEWEKCKQEYETLHDRIKTLPDKVSHDMMIPLGPLALVPGKLVHTNEITVLLGDNWFAERSSKQACEIIERKLRHCNAMLSKFREEEENIKNWIGYTQNMTQDTSEFVDICEEYDEEKEALWKEQHRKNTQQYRKQLAEERQNENIPSTSSYQLSVPQTASQPTYSLTEHAALSGGAGDAGFSHNRARRVSWQDQSVNVDNHHDSDSEDDEEICSLVIKFNHSDSSNTAGERFPESTNIITTPADIYTKFAHLLQKTPKSILKRKKCSLAESSQLPHRNIDMVIPNKISSPMISKVVQENVIECNPEERTTTSTATGRTTSRFKAQRELAQRKV